MLSLFPTLHTTVLDGNDSQVLSILLEIHAVPNPVILDCTYGLGVMWQDCNYWPRYRFDIRQLHYVNTVADFCAIPLPDNVCDVIVFDPPHLPAHTTKFHWVGRYGVTDDPARAGDNVISLFYPFLLEARRVLRPDGIVLAKIADIVHNHRYQWQQVAFVNACLRARLTPCDMLIKVRNPGPKSSKWKKQYHLHKAHCYWIVVRNSNRCERRKRKEKG